MPAFFWGGIDPGGKTSHLGGAETGNQSPSTRSTAYEMAMIATGRRAQTTNPIFALCLSRTGRPVADQPPGTGGSPSQPQPGTGSQPCPPQGWQRQIRFVASQPPRMAPCRRSAWTVYSEQVGRKRQVCGLSGEMNRWYPRTTSASTRAIMAAPEADSGSRPGLRDQHRHPVGRGLAHDRPDPGAGPGRRAPWAPIRAVRDRSRRGLRPRADQSAGARPHRDRPGHA